MKNRMNTFCGILGFALLTLFLVSCNDAKKENPEAVDPEMVEAPSNIITISEADAMYQNYTKHRVGVIDTYEAQERASEDTFEAARFVSYDLETIKQYIAFVEQESKKAGVTPNTLRFYFANYPDKENFPNGKKIVHKKQNSIFILPTLNQKGQDYGYYIGDNGKAKFIKDWKTGTMDGSEMLNKKSEASLFGFSTSTYSSQSLILNRGGSGPPPYPDF